MSAAKLSLAQRRVLTNVDENGFLKRLDPPLHDNVFNALKRHGLVEWSQFPGHSFSAWRITDAGRRALAEQGGGKT